MSAFVSVAALLAATVAVSQPAAAAPVRRSGSVSSVSDAASAASEAAARQVAERFGHSVVVDPETTATSQTVAEPDGSMQLSVSSVPVRVRQGSSWVPVNTTLSQGSGGMWTPVATVAPVRFGAGGSNVLDQVQTSGGDWITEAWPYGSLPAPTVSGATATYPDVLPGVDVVLTATSTGLSDVLEIQSATAAANPDLKALMLPVSGATVAATGSDTSTAKVSDGSAVVSASPVWWSAANGSNAQGPKGASEAMPMPHSISASGVSLSISSTVQAASPAFPVFVDPDWSTGANAFWFTDRAFPNQSYLNGNEASGIQAVGIGGGYQSDMFFQFPMGSLDGKIIQNAVVNTTQVWANSCSPSPIDVHVYGPDTPGFTWNQEQSWSGQWGGILQSQNPNAGCSGVGAAAVGWSVTSGVASYASAGRNTIQFAWTQDVGSSVLSRRHYAQSATLVVTYDTAPNTPSNPVMSSPQRGCGTSAAPVAVNGTVPITLQVTQTDPDGGNVADNFYLANASVPGTVVASYSTSFEASGSTFSWVIPANTYTSGTYAWWARGSDDVLNSVSNSSTCYFTVENTPPGIPSVTSADPVPIDVGDALPVDVIPVAGSGTVEFEYWWSYSTSTSPAPSVPVPVAVNGTLPDCSYTKWFVCANGDSTVSFNVYPPDTTATLWVAAFDAAGNVSTAGYLSVSGLGPMPGASNGHYWNLAAQSSPLPSVIPDTNTSSATGITGEKDLTIGAGIPLDSTDTVQPGPPTPVLTFAGGTPSAVVETSSAGVDTLSSFTVSAWVKPASATGGGTIVAETGELLSGFTLGEYEGAFAFCIQPQVAEVGPTCAFADPGDTSVNEWQMVTGIWDANSRQVRLVLGDTVTPVAVQDSPSWSGDRSASGPITVGSDEEVFSPADQWDGSISNVAVVPIVIDHDQLNELYDMTPVS